jgi:hypothetical protein
LHEPTLVDHRCFNIHIESLGTLNASLLDLHTTYSTNTVCFWHLANVNPHIDHSAVQCKFALSMCVYTERANIHWKGIVCIRSFYGGLTSAEGQKLQCFETKESDIFISTSEPILY